MLDYIRKHSQSFMVWLLVGAIAFIFIVQFGPQSRGCGRGRLKTDYVAKVYGFGLSPDAWRWAWVMHNGSQMDPKEAKAMRLRETVMDGLIERELLVREAGRMGLKVTEEEVEDSLLEGRLFMTSSVHALGRTSSSGVIPIDFSREDGSFDFETFQMFVTNRFHMTLASFKEQQIREMHAQHMRQLVEAAVHVSDTEVRGEYDRESDRAKVGYVSFDPAFWVRRLEPSDAEITAWIEQHLDDVKKKYDDESYKYKSVERQVRTRHILFALTSDATDEEIAAKKVLAEEILAKIKGGADFAKLASTSSDDEESAKRGGDLGFRSRGDLVEEYEDVAFGLKEGEIAGPVKTMFGFHIIRCEGFREGDIPFEDVRVEIGRSLMLMSVAREQARKAAEEFLAKIGSGEDMDSAAEALEAVFYPPPASPAPAPKVKPGAEPAAGQAAGDAPEEEAGKEEKPRDPLMPRFKESSWIQRTDDSIPGIGRSKDLIGEVFTLDPAKPLVGHVVSVGDRWYVVKLVERMEPTDSDFATKKADIKQLLEGEKKISLFTQWMDDLRAKAEKEGAIEINQAYLKYTMEEGEEEAEAGEGDEKAD